MKFKVLVKEARSREGMKVVVPSYSLAIASMDSLSGQPTHMHKHAGTHAHCIHTRVYQTQLVCSIILSRGIRDAADFSSSFYV